MTLTNTSKVVKRGVVLFGILVVAYYVFLWILIPSGKKLISSILPEKNPPVPVFGNLPPLEFVEVDIKNDNPSYKLDTPDGKLPGVSVKNMPVYQVLEPISSFEKGKDAQDTASKLGFYEDDLTSSLKDEVYVWRSSRSGGVLRINTNTRQLVLDTVVGTKFDKYPKGELNEKKALDYAENIFKDIGRFRDNLYVNGTQKVTFLEFYGNKLSITSTPLDAQLAKVDFFRSINDYPILGPDPKEALQYVYLKRPNNKELYYNYPIMESHVWEIKTQSNATYPIITVSEAWNLIKNNKGVVVNVDPAGSNFIQKITSVNVEEIFINDIYLAYYDNTAYQKYLQPIYVFSGTYNTPGTRGGEITIYYPAISPEYIQSASQ